MKAVGADSDFGTQAELAAIVEARAGIDHHGRRIDFVLKPDGRFETFCDNRIGVS